MKKTFIAIVGLLAVLVWGCSKLNNDYAINNNNKCLLCHALPPSDKVHAAHTERQKFDCGICHSGCIRQSDSTLIPSAILHNNGKVDVAVSSLFNPTGKAVYDDAAKTCSNVYCHGYFTGGDSAVVNVSDSISIRHCEACHNITQMKTIGHLPHTKDNAGIALANIMSKCENCHEGYSLKDSLVNVSNHVNGIAGPVSDSKCGACHSSVPQHTGRTQCVLCHVPQ
jgi:predicted CxxxxCH...CXXCH cytochrome family protein